LPRICASAWIAQGVLGEAELDELSAALKHHLEDPDTLVVSHLYVQAWGRKRAS
jgi:hypothetical protein